MFEYGFGGLCNLVVGGMGDLGFLGLKDLGAWGIFRASVKLCVA